MESILQTYFNRNAKIDQSQSDDCSKYRDVHSAMFSYMHMLSRSHSAGMILMLEDKFPFILCDCKRQSIIQHFVKENDLYFVSHWFKIIENKQGMQVDIAKAILQPKLKSICEEIESLDMISLVIKYGLKIPSLDKMLNLNYPSLAMVTYILTNKREQLANDGVDSMEITLDHLVDRADIIVNSERTYSNLGERSRYKQFAINSSDILVLLLRYCGKQVEHEFVSRILEDKQKYAILFHNIEFIVNAIDKDELIKMGFDLKFQDDIYGIGGYIGYRYGGPPIPKRHNLGGSLRDRDMNWLILDGNFEAVKAVLSQYRGKKTLYELGNIASCVDYWLEVSRYYLTLTKNSKIKQIIDVLERVSPHFHQQATGDIKDDPVEDEISLNRVYTLLNLFGRYVENANVPAKVAREFVSMIYCDEKYFCNKEGSYSLTNEHMKCFVSTPNDRKGLFLFHSILKDANLSNLLTIVAHVRKKPNANKNGSDSITQTTGVTSDNTDEKSPLALEIKEMENVIPENDDMYKDNDHSSDSTWKNYNIDDLLLLEDNNNQIPIECLMLGSYNTKYQLLKFGKKKKKKDKSQTDAISITKQDGELIELLHVIQRDTIRLKLQNIK